jgi:hypothetical protein
MTKFSELLAKMSPEAQAESRRRATEMLAQIEKDDRPLGNSAGKSFDGSAPIVGRIEFAPKSTAAIVNEITAPFEAMLTQMPSAGDLWPLVQTLERACWKRKWSEVTAARKALEARLGKRPSDPLFADVQAASSPSEARTDGQTQSERR